MKLDTTPQHLVWLNAKVAKAQMPGAAWNLVSQSGSLTEQLRNLTQDTIQHRLLFANWGYADSFEREALQLTPDEPVWVRCIEWCQQSTLWVHARAVFSQFTIEKTNATITGLGIQSLGDVIFKDHNLKRDPYQFACLDPNCLGEQNLEPAKKQDGALWARRSIIYFANQPILITEIFMPEAYATPNA